MSHYLVQLQKLYELLCLSLMLFGGYVLIHSHKSSFAESVPVSQILLVILSSLGFDLLSVGDDHLWREVSLLYPLAKLLNLLSEIANVIASCVDILKICPVHKIEVQITRILVSLVGFDFVLSQFEHFLRELAEDARLIKFQFRLVTKYLRRILYRTVTLCVLEVILRAVGAESSNWGVLAVPEYAFRLAIEIETIIASQIATFRLLVEAKGTSARPLMPNIQMTGFQNRTGRLLIVFLFVVAILYEFANLVHFQKRVRVV